MGIKSSCRDSGQREKINLNFDSLYGALKDFMNQKVFLSTTKKCENKNVSYFYFNTRREGFRGIDWRLMLSMYKYACLSLTRP